MNRSRGRYLVARWSEVKSSSYSLSYMVKFFRFGIFAQRKCSIVADGGRSAKEEDNITTKAGQNYTSAIYADPSFLLQQIDIIWERSLVVEPVATEPLGLQADIDCV